MYANDHNGAFYVAAMREDAPAFFEKNQKSKTI